MPTKRQILIAAVAVCAAALAAPLAFAGGSTGDEPESNATIVYVDPGRPIDWPDPPDPSGDVEQAEPPAHVTDTVEPATEEVTEEPQPEDATSEEQVRPGPRCSIVAKDYIVRDRDSETVTTDVDAGDEDSTDPADGVVPDDSAGEESTDLDENVIVEEPEPAETIEDGAELAGP